MIEQALEMIYTDNIQTKNGATSYYFPINEDWGFKFARRRYEIRSAYLAQKLAARHGIGPQVGHFASFIYRGQRWWGYITERVTTLWDTCKNLERLAMALNRGYLDRCEEIEIYHSFRENPRYKELISKFTSLFNKPCDDGYANIGIDKHGRYVYIDFGEVCWKFTKENFETIKTRQLLALPKYY